MRFARLIALVVYPAGVLSGCSIPESGGTGTETGECYNVEVCAALPLEKVNGALGGPFAYPVWSSPDRGPERYSDYCQYSKPETLGLFVARWCSADGAAASEYDRLHAGQVSPPNTTTDLSRVGDRAFVTEGPNAGPAGNYATLFAFEGNVFVLLDDGAVASDQDVREGLAELAKILFVQ